MVYISSTGTVAQKRSIFRISIFSDLFWWIINFFGLFFKTLIEPVDAQTRRPYEKRSPAFGQGGGNSVGGGDNSGRAPKNVRGMDALKKQSGACASAGG
mmetsp:Transcript_5918/g.7299  ORF Transcript_5918/g.7299 Transcript_5918/m.7299 type:complete len:99 (-) Transcript_5918:286-582(-)